jgi:hypothetical protein
MLNTGASFKIDLEDNLTNTSTVQNLGSTIVQEVQQDLDICGAARAVELV